MYVLKRTDRLVLFYVRSTSGEIHSRLTDMWFVIAVEAKNNVLLTYEEVFAGLFKYRKRIVIRYL